MSATGLSADPAEYQRRLQEQSDEQIDGWATELMRDMSIRQGVLPVLAEFRHATHLDDAALRRVFTAGGEHAPQRGVIEVGGVPELSQHREHALADRHVAHQLRRPAIDLLIGLLLQATLVFGGIG